MKLNDFNPKVESYLTKTICHQISRYFGISFLISKDYTLSNVIQKFVSNKKYNNNCGSPFNHRFIEAHAVHLHLLL